MMAGGKKQQTGAFILLSGLILCSYQMLCAAQRDSDRCSRNPCKNGGTCEVQVKGIQCHCTAGYTGKRCQNDADECSSNPCMNGGTCKDQVNGYKCKCAAGYKGRLCGNGINECESSPCRNRGSCVDRVNRYECSCVSGFTGPNCETSINECESSPCRNRGSCVDRVNRYECSCVSGFTGPNCETNIDDCSNNPCLNGGNCEDQVNGYQCICADGYTGTRCGRDVNECSNRYRCASQATCQNTHGSYTCTCNSGYSGNGRHYCADINECSLNRDNCSPDASCNNNVGSFSCRCRTGYSGNGVICEDINECSNPNRCARQATCQNTPGSFTCTCNSGYSGNGRRCTDINECSTRNNYPCAPQATCQNTVGSFTCTCRDGYNGNGFHCTERNECTSEPCLNGGQCVNRINGFSCTCKAEFTGIFCATELPILSAAPIHEDVTNTLITISWRAWDSSIDDGDPPVVAYIPYYRRNASDEWISGRRVLSNETLQFKADNLEVDTLYEFSVAAVRKGENDEGRRSPSVKVKTLCNVSDLAVSVNVQLTTSNKVNVSWQLPAVEIMCSTGVTSYKVYYKIEGSIDDTPQVAGTVKDVDTRWFIVDDEILQPGSSYIFSVTVHTDQESGFSESKPIEAPAGSHVGTILAVICVIVLLIILLLVILVIIKRKRDEKAGGNNPAPKYVENAYDNPVFGNPVERRQGAEAVSATKPVFQMPLAKRGDHEKISLESFSVDEDTSPDETIYGNLEPPQPIRVSEFKDYFKQNIDKFEQEFSILKGSKKQFDWTVAENPAYKKKNRFKNIYTYDHSRVVLKKIPDQEGSDYYNASFIRNANGVNAYIASQAPNKACLEDFIRMIWEQNVTTVVMVANLYEDGRERCQQYWPETEGSHKSFGSVTVTWLKTKKCSDFVIRYFEFNKGKKTHEVQQLHFLSWPDKDTPEHGTALIEFTKQSKLLHHWKKYPMLVHCSAGIGRTGTFICLSCMMDAVRDKEYFDVFAFVNKVRQNRVNMVQTSKQYVFLYKCLNEYHLTHQTEMTVRQIARLDIKSHRGILLGDFELLSELVHNPHKDTDENCAGKKRENIARNRVRNIVPSNRNRVFLMSPGRSNDGNYINASYVKSFQKKDAFVLTQSPLPNTTEDFWRMVYDVKSPLVVMLNQLDPTDTTCLQYWPDHGSREYGNMHITCMTTDEEPSSYIQRRFDVKHANSKEVLSVTHMQMKEWHPDTNLEGIVSLFKDVDMMHKSDQHTRPIVVHCINGFDRSGVMVTVISELERIAVTERIDVFSTVKKLRDQHEHMLKNKDDYILCFHLLKAYLTISNGECANKEERSK